jgi:5-methyltetrahydrofolate--homocysteine methyltransferase
VPVATSLLSKEEKTAFVAKIKEEYAQLRESHAQRQEAKTLISLSQARANKFVPTKPYTPTAPSFIGNRVFDNYPVEDLVPYIDWTPFFQTWELAGKYPAILNDAVVGAEARRLFDDAKRMLAYLVKEKKLQAKAVVGFYAARPDTDDILLTDLNGNTHRLCQLRQQRKKAANLPNLCLSDYILEEGDHIGGFAVGIFGADEQAKKHEAQHDDYASIMVKALADRLAEAFAEHLHERVRKEFWGYAKGENCNAEELIKEKYQGIRPAPGYPACPDHLQKGLLFKLLDIENSVGIQLTESYAMHPASAVSGWYFAHPEAIYFPVGLLAKDQVEDYAQRMNLPLNVVEKWLGSLIA